MMVQGESILIKAALNFTQGKRHEAVISPDYGRNTLNTGIGDIDELTCWGNYHPTKREIIIH